MGEWSSALRDSEFLGQDEVSRMTRRVRYRAQRRVLEEMRVTFWCHPDGSPLVPRAQFRGPGTMDLQAVEPDWEAIYDG